MNAIEVTKLGKTYPGGVEAVKSIDFEVSAGEVFGLLGPNGAGKSTTVGMLTTTIAPTSGTARLAGLDVAADPLAARRLSSVVFQDPVVDRALTGRRHLDLHARLWGGAPLRSRRDHPPGAHRGPRRSRRPPGRPGRRDRGAPRGRRRRPGARVAPRPRARRR